MDEEIKIEGDIDINQALQEFEIKSRVEQAQKNPETLKAPEVIKGKEVEGVKFEIPNYGTVKPHQETVTPKMVQLVIKWSGGAIKEQRQAEYILLGFVVLTILVSIFIFFNSSSNGTAPQISPEVFKQMGQPRPSTQ